MILLIGGPRDGEVVPEGTWSIGMPEYGRVDVTGAGFTRMNVAVWMQMLETHGVGPAYARIVRWVAHCEDNGLLDSLFS